MERIIKVEDMMCNNCVKHIENALLGIQGVKKIMCDLTSKNVTIISSVEIADDIISMAITKAGYTLSK